jgi:carboxyl-terminal processing protease
VIRRLAWTAALVTAAVACLDAQAAKSVETFDAVWTIVRDSHFDPAMNGVNWDAVRSELRPRAEASRHDGELRAVIGDMLGRLGQSHFALIPSSADPSSRGPSDLRAHPGFDVRLIQPDLIVSRVEPGGSAAAAGVRAGWILAAVDGRQMRDVLASLPESMPARLRQVEAWRVAQNRLRGPHGSSVSLTFTDGSGRVVPITLDRRPEAGEPVTVGSLPTMYVRVDSEARRTPAGRKAGVIAFNVWMPVVDGLFQKAIDEHRSADGIVLDLRGNPGGIAAMLMGISGHFLAERKPIGIMKTRQNKLSFASNPRLVSASGERVEPFAGPVAILVDAMTGSASECFAGGMQSLGRVRVFGQTSMGQALPALFNTLPNGDVLIHAYGDFVTSDGTRLEGRGVIPDEAIPLRREDLLAGRDAPLERALAWIDEAGARGPAR